MERNIEGLSFEEAVSRLEEIVASMETGELPLDECLRRFEEAVALSRVCSLQLQTAENRIDALTALAAGGEEQAG